jgi:hypothetical protein
MSVSWWPDERWATTFGHLPARVVTETTQHAGHADIIRETIDARGGLDHDGIGDANWWSQYVGGIQPQPTRSGEPNSARRPTGAPIGGGGR